MKLLAQSLLMSATLLLAACGGGSDDSAVGAATPPPQTNPPGANPPPNTSPYVIDYYGDSTIWGWATNTDGDLVSVPAPLAFANALPSPPQNEVRNEGVSGTTACDLLEGTDGVHPQWEEQMQQSDATHVIINHGINDRKAAYDVGRYQSCLEDLVQIARDNGKRVVLETPNPVSNDGLGAYVAAMRSVAAAAQPAVPLIDQYQYLNEYMAEQELALDDIVPDGEHPNEETYIRKGEYAAEVFTALFPR